MTLGAASAAVGADLARGRPGAVRARVRVRHLPPMLSAVLIATGLFATAAGCWRGYAAARAALVPLVREGEPTRALVDATRPAHARTRVRVVARNVLVSVAWLAVAMYGLFLATVGSGVRA